MTLFDPSSGAGLALRRGGGVTVSGGVILNGSTGLRAFQRRGEAGILASVPKLFDEIENAGKDDLCAHAQQQEGYEAGHHSGAAMA